MKHILQYNNRVEELRAQLRHFDSSPDFGDAEAVAAIRRHLLLRIREAESASQSGLWFDPRPQIEAA